MSAIKPSCRWLIDSGAFTAWKSNQTLDVRDYISFIRNLKDLPWRYFTLDVIGDKIGTNKNLLVLYDAGLKPIPIFTRGDDPNEIDSLYELSDLVGIGGLVGTPGNRGFVKGICPYIKDRKAHWLGFNNSSFLYAKKPYSCDSSSWSAGLRFGSIPIYLGNNRWAKIVRKELKSVPVSLKNLLNRYGADANKLRDPKEWVGCGWGLSLIQELTFKSWVRYQIDLEEKLGIKYFLSITTTEYCIQAKSAFDYWNQNVDEFDKFNFWTDQMMMNKKMWRKK